MHFGDLNEAVKISDRYKQAMNQIRNIIDGL